jgi:hypothetical protein
MDREAAKIITMVRNDLLSAIPRSEAVQPGIFYCSWAGERQIIGFTTDHQYELERAMRGAGNGIDDDGDGDIDEEFPDGLDNEAGDGLDNDNDSQIDEEAFNSIDDDGDSRIDEDCFGDGLVDEDCRAAGFPVVIYATDPPRQYADGSDVPLRPILWRGYFAGSLPHPSAFSTASSPSEIHRKFMPLSQYCMFLEMRFETSETTTWLSTVSPADGGPHFLWDYTRKLGPGSLGSANFPEGWKHAPFHSEEGDVNADEVVFPGRVLVSIGLVPDDEPFAYLTKDISSGDDRMYLSTTDGLPAGMGEDWADMHQLLYVGGEWIVYEEAVAKSVRALQRGARFSTASAHSSGEPVWSVLVFTTEIYLPAAKMPR